MRLKPTPLKLETEDKRIKYYGSKKDVAKAKVTIGKLYTLDMKEPDARLLIQDAMHKHNLKADILFNGNGVWNQTRIIRNLNKIIEHGTLYAKDRLDYRPIGSMLRMPVIGETHLSDYFYKFLHLCCGSIAHYNKCGWVAEYPTVHDLKNFFIKNEFGRRVLDDVPDWKTDVKRIVKEIEEKLGITDEDIEKSKPKPMFSMGITEDNRIVYVPTFDIPPRKA